MIISTLIARFTSMKYFLLLTSFCIAGNILFANNATTESIKLLTAVKNISNLYSNNIAPCLDGPGVIGGLAFEDYNFNGLNDQTQRGLEGMIVNAYSCDANDDSMLAGTATTDANGEYFIAGLTDGVRYRIEFIKPASLEYYSYAVIGDESQSSVQYVTAPSCDVNIGLARPADFHQDNPFIIIPCYINGQAFGPNVADTTALVGVKYNAAGANQNFIFANQTDVGSLWGTVYERTTETVISAAVLRRHVGLGPQGIGALYFTNISDALNPVQTGFLDLSALGFDLGTDPRMGMDTLPLNLNEPSHDAAAFGLIGEIGFGDLEMSDDGKKVYATNLKTKEILAIDLQEFIETGVVPSSANVTAIPIPDPGCANGDFRPWGLKVRDGQVYVGTVCSAETSGDEADLHVWIQSWDGSAWTSVFDFPLDFNRGSTITNQPQVNQWFAWTDDWTETITGGSFNHPQPIISDIEFDTDGSIILGFMDRTSMQGGFLNFSPDFNDTQTYGTVSGGDILRICNVNGTLVLENDPNGGCQTALGVNANQGPNGGEYYWSDYFDYNPFDLNPDPGTNPSVIHSEITLGALAILPGSGEIVSTAFDPTSAFNSGGLIWMNNEDGSRRTEDYQIFESFGIAFPGKSNGLGDIELAGEVAPIEIGNYVWQDCNGDGIQDACEDPIEGVELTVYNEACEPMATVVTDANGLYVFNEEILTASNMTADSVFAPNSVYYVVLGTGGQFDAGTGVLFNQYMLSAADGDPSANGDERDNDGVIGDASAPACALGLPYAEHSTGCIGKVNHSIDFGLSVGVVMVDVLIADESCSGQEDGTITINATSNTTSALEYSIDGGVTFVSTNVFTGLSFGTYDIVAQIENIAEGVCGGSAETSVTIIEGEVIEVPTTTGYLICQNAEIPSGEGLLAECAPCVDNEGAESSASILWYDAETDGNLLFTGAIFNPLLFNAGLGATPGDYTFFAACSCGDCESERTPTVFSVRLNPEPIIEGPEFVCPGETATYSIIGMNGSHTYNWTVSGDATIIGSPNETTVTIEFGTNEAQTYSLSVTETGPTGCSGMDDLNVTTKNTQVVCNDNLQISLDETGCATITADQILEGDLITYDCFTITITNAAGQAVGVGNKIDCSTIGQTLTVNVTSDCTGNSCWSTITIEDKLAPVFDCPASPIAFDCGQDLDLLPFPLATDNCELVHIELTLEEVIEDDVCNGYVVERSYVATDEQGNSSLPCTVTYEMTDSGIPDLPNDITWHCNQYNAYPSIIEVGPVTDAIYDTDPSDSDVDVASYLANTIIGSSNSGEVLGFVNGLCPYSISHNDETLSACGNPGFKILRTWTVLNWCTGELVTLDEEGDDNLQIIKIVDVQAPVIEQSPMIVQANLPALDPLVCRSTEWIAAPEFLYDNCNEITLKIFVGTGELNYTNGDPLQGGTIPAPGLELGEHVLTYSATDACGNEAIFETTVTVVDEVKPTIVCDQITDVSLTTNGTAEVFAMSFDDGSYDNCCLDNFAVRRMDQPSAAFTPSVLFTCEDEEVTVILRVTDCFGNYNECMVQVFVSDKLVPEIVECPNNQSIDCDFYLNNLNAQLGAEDYSVLAQFGTAEFYDNCNLNVDYTVTVDVNSCIVGTITRTWIATDDNPENASISCTQIINIAHLSDWEVVFPNDIDAECTDGALPDFGEPQVFNDECEMIGSAYEDQVFTITPDACYKIVRTWEVINWCIFDLYGADVIADPQVGARRFADGGDGYITYNQVIKVVDNEAPVITYIGDTSFCSLDEDCVDGPVSLPVEISEDCSDELTLTWQLDLNYDGSIDSSGDGVFDANVILGAHRLYYSVTDECGNQDGILIDFLVKDCKKPTPYCKTGLIIEIMQNGTAEIWASDLDLGSFDNCSDVTVSFSDNPLDNVRQLDCSHKGYTQWELWVTDAAGNQDLCVTEVYLQDNMNACPGVPLVAGTIETAEDQSVENVSVDLNGFLANQTTTSEDGTYELAIDEPGNDYSITPLLDENPTNGVTTYDLVLISKHILGVSPFDSPYKMIAADANNSGSITTYDMVVLRKLILVVDTEFENNTSWRFVDADYAFPQANNPWMEEFPEVINYNNLTQDDLGADFVAIKIGDVNGSAISNSTIEVEDRSTGMLNFEIENQLFEEGEELVLNFGTKDFNDIEGYQFTFEFNAEKLQFQDVITAVATEQNFGLTKVQDGFIMLSWNESIDNLDSGAIHFGLSFVATQAGEIKNEVAISSAYTSAEAYNADEVWNIGLEFLSEDGNTFKLLQNVPNPFDSETLIAFYLPSASDATMTINDMSGKTIKVIQDSYTQGYNEIKVNQADLGTTGVLYYRLETPSQSASKKMILLK